jgi:hypothetical protein
MLKFTKRASEAGLMYKPLGWQKGRSKYMYVSLQSQTLYVRIDLKQHHHCATLLRHNVLKLSNLRQQ